MEDYLDDKNLYPNMSNLYKNKYRIDTTRLKGWDYGNSSSYFITICTKNRFCWFANIFNAKMILSNSGKIIDTFWKKIPGHFNNVILGPFIIMPNHLHGILNLIDNNNVETRFDRVCKNKSNVQSDKKMDNSNKETRFNRVSTRGGITGIKNPMLNNSVSRIIRWYKGRCTYEIRKLKNDYYFEWQTRFYDHIIRNEKEYLQISQYIKNNPLKWHQDRYHQT
jgi:REP-associated tyrosine transposase